jgi:hypothetical protein
MIALVKMKGTARGRLVARSRGEVEVGVIRG